MYKRQISSYVLKKGYNTDDVYAIVSNYRTGELLAVYGKAFRTLLSPGSAIKPVIAASVLDLDPDKKNFTYDCTEANHVFKTEGGTFKIGCSEGLHGQMDMGSGMAKSLSLIHIFNRFRRRERMNKKKVYEKKLNNLKKYKMDELKKITVQQQEMMSKITGFMELQDQVLTTMAGILSEQDQQICGMTETMKARCV